MSQVVFIQWLVFLALLLVVVVQSESHETEHNRRIYHQGYNKNRVNVVALKRPLPPMIPPRVLPPPLNILTSTMTVTCTQSVTASAAPITETQTSLLNLIQTETQTCTESVTQTQYIPTTFTNYQTCLESTFFTVMATETTMTPLIYTLTCSTTESVFQTLTETRTSSCPASSVLPTEETSQSLPCLPLPQKSQSIEKSWAYGAN
jgi:hypothetical protein